MKAILGLSGGVDSSSTLAILKEQNIEVIAISMINTDLERQIRDIENAKRICEKFNTKQKVIDMREEFKEKVIKRFASDYENGRTPNPCAVCNRFVKFKMLIDEMKKEGADFVATGHYANIVKLPNGRYAIKQSHSTNKDQSYLLYNLTQEQLEYIRFPLADKEKKDVRTFMSNIDKFTAEKRDSFDLCFIDDLDYVEYIKRFELGNDYKEEISKGNLKLDKNFLNKGRFLDLEGNVIGYHDGILNYTIGQRRGLNMGFGKRKYVLDINSDTLDITLCDDKDLFKDKFVVGEVNFQAIEGFEENKEYIYKCKVRYRDKGVPCHIIRKGDKLYCKLEEKVRAITKGQSAVFYEEEITICGGTILEIEND